MLIELQVMREFEILPKPLNDIYNSGYTQSDILKSVFIALSKRAELKATISNN